MDVEQDFRTIDGEEDLGLFGDLSAFEGLRIEEESAAGKQSTESGGLHCPHHLGKYKNPRVLLFGFQLWAYLEVSTETFNWNLVIVFQL